MNKKVFVQQRFIMVGMLFFFCLPVTFPAVTAYAELMIYPAKGQTAEQQQKDEYECHQWAVEQTG